MTKQEFLQQLNATLTGSKYTLSDNEIKEIITDYEMYFFDAIAEGRDEQEVAKSLGDPNVIAKEFLAEQYIEKWEETKNFKNLWYVLSVNASLGLLNVGVSLPVFIAMFFTTLFTVIFSLLAIVGTVLTLIVASNLIFGVPNINDHYINTHGIGPVFINTSNTNSNVPIIDISKDGESFNMQLDDEGALVVKANEEQETFSLKKRADGTIEHIMVEGKDGESVNLHEIKPVSNFVKFIFSLLMAIVGIFGFVVCRKLTTLLLNFWKKHFQWSRKIKSQFV